MPIYHVYPYIYIYIYIIINANLKKTNSVDPYYVVYDA